MTNKEVFESGKILQFYSIDYNPMTGYSEINSGIEHLILYNNNVYSVLTDNFGYIADSDGEPTLISTEPETFMRDLCSPTDEYTERYSLKNESEHFDIGDIIEWDELDRIDKLGWDRNDDW